MRADYDSQGDTLSIELEVVERLDHGDDEVHPRAIVHLVADRPVAIDVLRAAVDVEEPLAAAAERYELDLESLTAAARSALAAPDRVVTLDVALRR